MPRYEVTTGGARAPGMFYGWIVVFAAFISFATVYGTITYSFGVFVNPIAAAFSVSPTQVLLGFTLTNIGTGLLGVYAGRLLGRYPIHLCMSAGLVILALGFLAVSFATTLWQFLAIYAAVISFGAALVAPLGAAAVVTNWFTQSRGRALTIATLGTSFGQLLLPRLAAYFIDGWSWQAAYQVFALGLIVIALPITFFLVVDRPGLKGVQPYGSDAGPSSADSSDPTLRLSTKEVLGRSDFWAIAVGYGLAVMVYLALVATIIPYARTFGVSAIRASELAMCMGLFAILGKLGFATWTDRIGLRNTFWIAIGLNVAGLAALLLVPDYRILFVASACIGGSAGGLLPLWPGFIAFRFGRQSLSQVMGLMSPFVVVLQGLGAPLASALNYRLAFMIFIALLAISIVVTGHLNKPLVK